MMTQEPINQQNRDKESEAVTLHNLASIDMEHGEYNAAQEKYQRSLEISQQIENKAGEATTWHQLASIDVERGEYNAAQEKYQKSLEINQQIGDEAGEAASWHQLATIDLKHGEYYPAQEKLQKSLEINQQIGDKVGEATTIAQIGIMVAGEGHAEEGLRLVTLSAMSLKDIGDADLERVEPWVNRLASELEYSQERFGAMLQEVAKAYRQDQGRGLVEAALGAR